ncbi:methyltransferase domain-containing protein [Streptomyces sp. NPDC056503]|uniref:spermidine synthase n=1 Tax=Streptomyces sp. NPDC056503 TaxID=3345842 RepID=UPI0036956EE2
MYGATPLLLSTSATLLAGDRVFVGNQPDDFAVGPLVGPADEVCVLGLGYGGSLRPLLAASPTSRVTAVDLDPGMATVTRALFRQHFPQAEFRTEVADAATFLDGDRRFDLVLIDVYAGESYPSFILDADFWQRVHRVTRGGTVLLNAWGLPSHLDPFSPPSPQHTLATLLAPLWPHARYLPCRRNMTVVLRDTWPDPETGLPALPSDLDVRLTPTDAAVLRLQRMRLHRAEPFRLPDGGDAEPAALTDVPTTPERLDAEMARRWPAMLDAVRAHAEAAGVDASAVGTRAFYDRPDIAVPTTLELARRGHPAAALLPHVSASLTFAGDTSLGWYGEWMADEAEKLAAELPDWLVRTALPQALAMAANPLVPAWPWTGKLLDRTTALAAVR